MSEAELLANLMWQRKTRNASAVIGARLPSGIPYVAQAKDVEPGTQCVKQPMDDRFLTTGTRAIFTDPGWTLESPGDTL